MKTVILQPTAQNIQMCADELKSGGLVAFPTETVYGLGADASNIEAGNKVYQAKGRPSDNPLIVHVYERAQLDAFVAEVPPCAEKLIEAFMPGPLTLIFKKRPGVIPDIITGKLGTVAVRIPSHPIALELLRVCGLPVCAPSANTSTKPSPTRAKHVLDDLDGKLRYILDGGDCEIGVESTILDVSAEKPRILRLGGLPLEAFVPYIGIPEIVRSSDVPLCPGMKYKHYAPKANVLFSAFYPEMYKTVCEHYDILAARGQNPVILCLNANAPLYGERNKITVGANENDYAHNLFMDLRRADDEKYDTVIAEGLSEKGLGAAVINRLVKSSGGQVI